jgi:preprotein translocase subunit SecG
MIFFIGFLTVVLVLDCLLLILLVLIQLPKKEAGAGIAFGGAATDALFGAGAGNVLTKATKYATVAFFALLLLIGLVQTRAFKKDAKDFQKAVAQESKQAGAPLLPTTTAPAPAVSPAVSNLLTTTVASLTNSPSGTATNPAPVAPK